MHVERTGQVDPLTPQIETFIRERLGGMSLDTPDMSADERPDWICRDGQVVIEIKTLEGNGAERIEHLHEKFSKRDDWPVFFGEMPFSKAIANTSEPDKLNAEAVDRLGRPIRRHVRKAASQLAAHEARVGRDDLLRLVWLINEDHEIYDPASTGHIIGKSLRLDGREKGPLLNVDAVLYSSQRHVQIIDGQITFPILTVYGPGSRGHDWKQDMVRSMVREWASWQGASYSDRKVAIGGFKAIEAVPDKLKRHDLWRLEYRRSPYLQALSDKQLRERFDELMVLQLMAKHRDAPQRADGLKILELQTHLMQECNGRGLPLAAFPATREGYMTAADRLALSEPVRAWLQQVWDSRAA